jgi:hypothetical protein
LHRDGGDGAWRKRWQWGLGDRRAGGQRCYSERLGQTCIGYATSASEAIFIWILVNYLPNLGSLEYASSEFMDIMTPWDKFLRIASEIYSCILSEGEGGGASGNSNIYHLLQVHLSAPNVDQFINLLLAIPAQGYNNSLAYIMSEWSQLQSKSS